MKRPVRPWEAAVGGVLLAGLAWFLVQWIAEGLIHSRKTQAVPDLKGRSLAAAVDMLAALNLGLKKEGTEFNSGVPVSAVIRQTPAPGTTVREGKVIRVVLSQGGETVFVPNVVGLPLRNAEMLMRQGSLALGEVSEAYSMRLDKGMVLSQEPKAETSVERNSLINVVISGGPPPAGVLLMPDFLRRNIAEATAWAAQQRMTVSVSSDSTSLFPYGVILTQVPPPDSVLAPESTVSFIVSGHLSSSAQGASSSKILHYELSQGSSESLIRIVVSDRYGERELFNGLRRPGSKIDLPIEETGSARVKIFVNGILVEERDL